MVLSGLDILRTGIGAYVALWLVCACYTAICLRKKPNVHKYEKWSFYSVGFRWCGWVFGFFVAILLSWILPKVNVVTQKIERKEKVISEYTQEGWKEVTKVTSQETFHVNTYYVPFSYHGHRCDATFTYLINETDSTLALYSTEIYNGLFESVSNKDGLEIIAPQSFQKYHRNIDNAFVAPTESFSYIPQERKDKKVELTITLLSQALRDIERISNKIEERNILLQEAAKRAADSIIREFPRKQLSEYKKRKLKNQQTETQYDQ